MSSSPRGQWIAVGIIVAVLAGALAVGVLLSDDLMRVEVGSQAPPFTATDLTTGDTVSFADYQGDVVFLNVWATWCAPCRVEMPAIERLHEELGPEGLKVLAVSVDVGDPKNITDFARELELSFHILHDETQQIEIAYQTTGLPETFVIDRSGTIVHWQIGPGQWDSPANIARIRRLLEAAD